MPASVFIPDTSVFSVNYCMFGPEVFFCFSVNSFRSLMLPRSQK